MRDAAANPDDSFFIERLNEAPKLEHEFYLDAFWELCTERTFGMSEGPIPVSKMWQYAREYDLTISEQKAFVYIIKELDAAYITTKAEQSKSSSR